MATESLNRSAWIRSPLWDSIWILNGPLASLLILLVLQFTSPFVVVLVISVIVQRAHIFAPVFLGWARPDFRAVMLQKKNCFVWFPVAMTLACILAGCLSALLDPSLAQSKGIFYGLLVVYALWSTHHIAGQNFGLLSIYRHRQETENAQRRRIDQYYAFFMMGIPIPMLLLTGAKSPFLNSPPIHVPGEYIPPIRVACVVISIFATALMVAFELRGRKTRSWPRVLLILQMGLPGVLGYWHGVFYFGMVLVNHYVSSIGISSHAFWNHRRRVSNQERSGWPLLAIAALLYLISIPFCAAFYHFTLKYLPFHPETAGLWERMLRAGLLGLFFSEGYLHFHYDRQVYKVSHPSVRDTIGVDL